MSPSRKTTSHPPSRSGKNGGRGPAKRKKKKATYSPYHMRVPQTIWLVPVALLLGFGGVGLFFLQEEMRTSKLQAQYLTEVASDIHFEMKPGMNTELRVPTFGPYNQRLGYSYLPFFVKSLTSRHYAIEAQMRASEKYKNLTAYGLYPIYPTKTSAGLRLADSNGTTLYAAAYPTRLFARFEDIPPLLRDTLLFVENRELLQPASITRNPVIEWDRFIFAAFMHFVQKIAPGVNAGGGSTLATQIEKFRFSPGGQTIDAGDKLRQIASGSLRVYLNGQDTREARKNIVLDYLNSTPLSARPGFGEVNSIGDGLWAWFGIDLKDASAALNLPETDAASLRTKAFAFRSALGLILAQRRPTAYLMTNRAELDELTDTTLNQMAAKGVISPALRDAAKSMRFLFAAEAPPSAPLITTDQKATNAMRTHLLSILGLKNLYELDRIDLSAVTTIDRTANEGVAEFLKKMGDRAFVEANGFFGFRLLKPENDPAKIKWSVLLYERGEDGNRLRVQADNIDGPLDMNDGVKLDLGSTAKLRTLITYLEIIGELHRRYAGLSPEDLTDIATEAPDNLTEWATTWLAAQPNATLDLMIEAAMQRKYSGSPYETFFTGGGAHTFVNFEKSEDNQNYNLYDALKDSVNLVFVRLMRDIVNYTIAQGQQTKQEILGDRDNPARKEYLERYADKEGQTFLNRYINEYKDLSPDEAMERITKRAHKGATARTVLFRALRPQADYASFVAYMKKNALPTFDFTRMEKLYRDYPPDRYNLADQGYVAGINPLELWLVTYLQKNPKASRTAILEDSRTVRLESYRWLFHPRLKGAQDTRIRILLEQDAFARIQQRWARLGYPFEKLVPSLATSIGSSADKPSALAELVGILVNDGFRNPSVRFEQLRFAADTPYETILTPGKGKGFQVLEPAVAKTIRAAMREVVDHGTAKRLSGAYKDKDGNILPVGGKTGTGDHRYEEFGAGGRLISSRVVNRTGSIVFYIGDRFFGTITAHVSGEEAEAFKFTSALSAQMLKAMAPILQPLINGTKPSPDAKE